MSTLAEVEIAAKALPRDEQESLLARLSEHIKSQCEPTRRHSILDIKPVSLGKILKPFDSNDDVLEEMLEHRV